MNTQTGVTPRPRGEANRIVVFSGPAVCAAILAIAWTGMPSFSSAQEENPALPDPAPLTPKSDAFRLLAQSQRAAAEGQRAPSADAPSSATEAAGDAKDAPAKDGDDKTPSPTADAANGDAAAPAPAPAPDAAAAPADGDANDALNALAEMAEEAKAADTSAAPAADGDNANPAPNADANANPTTPAPNAPDGAATPQPGDGAGRRPGGFGGRGGFGPTGGGGAESQTGLVRGPSGRVTLQFPLNPVSDLLNIYERLINKTIVKDTTVFDGPQVSLVTPSDVSVDEAVHLIEATLLVNGYVIVAEPDAESVKVLFGGQRQGGQSASFSEGVVVYTGDDTLPAGETLIGYFMKLDYISPETAATLFGNHVVLNEFGRITPVTTPSGLLITESSSIIRQLIQLKQIIDVAADEAPLLTEFVKLEYAEANIVAQIIQAAMDARMEERQRQSDSGRTISGQRSNQGGGDNNNSNNSRSQPTQTQIVRTSNGPVVVNNADANTGIGTADMPAAQLIPDDRLNRIMVVAAPTDLAYVLDLIKEFDQPLSTPDPMERPLNYVKANDILPVIVDVLQDTGTGQTQLPGGRQIDTRPTPVTSSQLATLTGVNRTQNQQNRNTQTNTSTDTLGERPDQIAFPIDEVAPISVLVGKTRLIADRQSNAIIVIGSAENQQIVLDIIDRLDRRPMQVYLATVIGELSLSDDVEFGIDYLQKFVQFSGDNPADGGIASSLINSRDDILGLNGAAGNIADLRDNIITTPFGPASGLNVYGQIGESLDVIVTALQQNTNFKVLSRPVVYTQNGKRAEITSGQEVPYPESSLSDTTNVNSVRSTVAYKDVVLKLEVLPTINEDNEVTLDIVQVNDRVVGQQLVDQNLIPVIGKQELNTTVTIPNHSTIVLGGLISETDDKSDAGVPFLKNIPLVGNAVKNTAKSKTRSELMIFLQPIVVREDEDAFTASYDEDVRSHIGEDAARAFPEPGVPTMQYEADEQEQAERIEKRGFLGRIGRGIFGEKEHGRGRPVLITPVEEDTSVPSAPPKKLKR
ncbi:MAG: hypothetical protein KDN19_03390 [Verrucomicrobiae bacterium]|nr:hypothetical protein [Verrucomicrobiae bacterium]